MSTRHEGSRLVADQLATRLAMIAPSIPSHRPFLQIADPRALVVVLLLFPCKAKTNILIFLNLMLGTEVALIPNKQLTLESVSFFQFLST